MNDLLANAAEEPESRAKLDVIMQIMARILAAYPDRKSLYDEMIVVSEGVSQAADALGEQDAESAQGLDIYASSFQAALTKLFSLCEKDTHPVRAA